MLHFQNSPAKSSQRYEHAVARADVVICCSRFIREQLAKALDRLPARVEIVYNGVEQPSNLRIDREVARREFAIPGKQIAVLYVGRIGPEKGLLVLIEAFAKLRESGGPTPLLLVAGAGTLGFEGHRAAWAQLQAYERLVRDRAADLPVRFLGSVARAELPRLYSAGDIFVCPSIYEDPFPLVNVEAAGAGLPVIGSAVGGIPEAVQHEQTGLLVPPGDSDALAQALARLIADRPLRDRLGRAAEAMASRFTWSLIASRVTDLYSQALRRSVSDGYAVS